MTAATPLPTKRLRLRAFTLQDAPFIHALLNSPNWLAHIGPRGINSHVHARQYLQNGPLKSYKERGFGLLCMELATSATPIGMCGFLQRTYLPAPDLGFAILPQYEGQGYTTEAAQALIQHAFATLHWPRLMAITTAQNHASKAVLQNLGFVFQKNIQPEAQALLLYALQAPEIKQAT